MIFFMVGLLLKALSGHYILVFGTSFWKLRVSFGQF